MRRQIRRLADSWFPLETAKAETRPIASRRPAIHIATTATVRRHLGKMIAEGTVIKNTPASDRRTAHLTLNPKTMEALDRSLEKIHHTLCISMTQGRDD